MAGIHNRTSGTSPPRSGTGCIDSEARAERAQQQSSTRTSPSAPAWRAIRRAVAAPSGDTGTGLAASTAGQLAALAWPVHAQHRAQLGQLPGMRQGQRQDRRGGDGDGADGGHGYQLTARLAETARPGRV